MENLQKFSKICAQKCHIWGWKPQFWEIWGQNWNCDNHNLLRGKFAVVCQNSTIFFPA